jgi:hypothetical protein
MLSADGPNRRVGDKGVRAQQGLMRRFAPQPD